jgi:hypothetical protein
VTQRLREAGETVTPVGTIVPPQGGRHTLLRNLAGQWPG